MATRSTRSNKAGAAAVQVEGVGPDAEAATPTPPDTPAEAQGADTREDARAAALAALVNGAEPAPAPGQDDRPPVVTDAEAHPEDLDVDGGGRARRVVTFDRFRWWDKDGRVLEARRGQVVSVTAEVAERGEGLGALAPLTDG